MFQILLYHLRKVSLQWIFTIPYIHKLQTASKTKTFKLKLTKIFVSVCVCVRKRDSEKEIKLTDYGCVHGLGYVFRAWDSSRREEKNCER
jgi:hypothetical protein